MMSNQEIVNYELDSITYRRPDGTYVGIVRGLPYHVVPEDRLWSKAQEMANALGNNLPFEPEAVPAAGQPLQRYLTARQLRLSLMRRTITAQTVVSEISKVSDQLKKEELLVEWEYGTDFKRSHTLILFIETNIVKSTDIMNSIWEVGLGI